MKRRLVETLDRRKDQMIAALWSNSNYDDGKETRRNAISDIEENFNNAIEMIMSGAQAEEEVQMEDTYGFFAAGERGVEKIQGSFKTDGTVSEAIETESLDQG